MIQVDHTICDTCGTCISICPENALTLTDSLTIDYELCCECQQCVYICPFGALMLSGKEGREAMGGK